MPQRLSHSRRIIRNKSYFPIKRAYHAAEIRWPHILSVQTSIDTGVCTHGAGNACLLPVSIGDIASFASATTLILRVASFAISFARKSINGKSYSVISEGRKSYPEDDLRGPPACKLAWNWLKRAWYGFFFFGNLFDRKWEFFDLSLVEKCVFV